MVSGNRRRRHDGNVSDFLVKLYQGGTSGGGASPGYDGLGSALLGGQGQGEPVGPLSEVGRKPNISEFDHQNYTKNSHR